MKHFAALLGLVIALSAPQAFAQSTPDDQYVSIYNNIQQADSLLAAGQTRQALNGYGQAQSDLLKFQKVFPDWNVRVVNFRLNYVAGKIGELTAKVPTNAPAMTARSGAAGSQSAAGAASSSVNNAQLQNLQGENDNLKAKLKEALSAQPTAANSQELVMAQSQIKSLLRENELLRASLGQNQGTTTNEASNETQLELAAVQARAAKLAQENQSLHAQLQAPINAANSSNNSAAQALRQENELLRKQLNQFQASSQSKSTGNSAPEVDKLRAQVAALQSDFDVNWLEKMALEKRLQQQGTPSTASTATSSSSAPSMTSTSTSSSSSAPSTSSSMVSSTTPAPAPAVAKTSTTTTTTPSMPVTVPKPSSTSAPSTTASTTKPASSTTTAKKKSSKNSKTNNVAKPSMSTSTEVATTPSPKPKPMPTPTVVANPTPTVTAAATATTESTTTAAATPARGSSNSSSLVVQALNEIGSGQLDSAEQHLRDAMARNPDDAYTLSAYGYLKYRQHKYDDAYEALTRAARLDPNNAQVQNYLGVTLSQRGQRAEAEDALLKAVSIDPNYGAAHNNLAIIYLNDNPPKVDLAREHYQKALQSGAPHNANVEKLLASKGAAVGQ